MIKLGGLVGLNPLNEVEGFTATSKETGTTSVFKTKDARDAAIKAGTHEKRKDDKDTPISVGKDKETPKVNIFNKDKEEPKSEPSKETPKSEPKGNPDANKSVRAKADSLEITPEKLGEEDYQDTMVAAAHEALTDSNFHSEARKLLAIVTGDEKLAEKPDYPKMDDPDFSEKMYQISKDREAGNKYTNPENDKADILGQTASSEAGWGGEDALYSITSTLREKGFDELADKMDSIFDEEDKNESVTESAGCGCGCGCGGSKKNESINEVAYNDALTDFNKELEKNSEVKKAAKHYKKSTKDVVKALQSKIKVNRYSDKSIKQISIDYSEDGPLSSKVSIKLSKDYQQNESVNEGQYKTIMSNGGRNLFFAVVDDKTDKVDTIDLKKWLKTSLKDKSSDVSKDRIVKAILKGQKQFNKSVEYNMWSKKGKPSFEDKINYFIKNGFINNITSKGIKVYESNESSKLTDLLGDE